MAQLPPASQPASASHVAPLVTGGTSVPGFAPTRTTDGRAGVITSLAIGRRPVSAPLTTAIAYVTRCSPGVPGSSTTCRLMFMVGSSIVCAGGGNGTCCVTFSMRVLVTTTVIPSVTGVDGAGTTL